MSFLNKIGFGESSFARKSFRSIAEAVLILVAVAGFLYLGFLGNAAITEYKKVKAAMVYKEVLANSPAQNDIQDKNSEQYYMASIMLYSQAVEDGSAEAIEDIAKEKKEQRIREEQKKKEQEEKKAITLASRGGYSVTDRERDLLEKIVMAEAGAEPYEGKIAVVNVILNRVAHKSYPNTIAGVIFQKGQFTPAMNGTIWKMKPTASVKKAVQEALNGKRAVDKDVLYFLNPELATDHSIPRTKKFVKRIGNHAFYK